ncbi:MAG: hypothetical protein C0622_08335 [Desulfuromonas sp.]|nr:MAG: hypothetical protein C0622_08335 [Desulfuromonas sp.]
MTEPSYLIQGLADYVATLRFETLSPRAVEVAKQCVLDAYGNMVYGRYCEIANAILQYLETTQTEPLSEAKVAVLDAEGRMADKQSAVFAHSMMARCADLDDGYRHAMGHPGSSLVPLSLSLAQLYGCNGKEMLTALVAGYDIYARLGEAFNPFMYRERGFDATGVCGAVAAAAIVGKMAGSSAEVIKNAMGLASLFAGGLIEYQNDGTSGKIFCGGWGALSGMRAHALATCGFTGPHAALEGKQGFFQAFMGTSGHLNTQQVLQNLRSDFKITSIYFKRHACQRGLHALLDAVLDIRAEGALTPAQVEAVDIHTTTFIQRLSNPEPKTAVGGQASAQFTAAVALKHGRMDSEHLMVESFEDPEVKELAGKVKVLHDKQVQAYLGDNPTHFCSARVVLRTNDGRRFERWAPVPQGDIESPFGWDVLRLKFERLIAGTPFAASGEERFRFIATLEQAESVGWLFQAELRSK